MKQLPLILSSPPPQRLSTLLGSPWVRGVMADLMPGVDVSMAAGLNLTSPRVAQAASLAGVSEGDVRGIERIKREKRENKRT